jgi:hypothetical protein
MLTTFRLAVLLALTLSPFNAPWPAVVLVWLAMEWATVIPVFVAGLGTMGVVAGAVATYFGVKRERSGTVNTSQAETIYKEQRDLLDRFKVELTETRRESAENHRQVVVLNEERITDRAKIMELEFRLKLGDARIASLEDEVIRLKAARPNE